MEKDIDLEEIQKRMIQVAKDNGADQPGFDWEDGTLMVPEDLVKTLEMITGIRADGSKVGEV